MQRQIINGLMALTTSLLTCKLPESWWGWFVLFMPGGALTVLGWVGIFRHYR